MCGPQRPSGACRPERRSRASTVSASTAAEDLRLGVLGNALNPTRKPVRDLTGQNWVPVLVTDEDEVVQGSGKIVEWAEANPATASDA